MAELGRPTQYDPAYVAQAEKLCLLGATDDEMADFFGVHRSTIYRWKVENEDFCNAVKSGKQAADERVERSLYQKATGYNVKVEQAVKVKVEQYREEVEVVEVEQHVPSDTTAAIFWLKNRRPADWRDKQLVEHSGEMKIEQVAEDASAVERRLVQGLAGIGAVGKAPATQH